MSVSMSVLPNEVQRMVLEQLPYPSRAGCNRVSSLWRYLILSLPLSELEKEEAIKSSISSIHRYRKISGKSALPSDPRVQFISLEHGGALSKIFIKNYTNHTIWVEANFDGNPDEKFSLFVDDKKISNITDLSSCYFITEEEEEGTLWITQNDFNSNVIHNDSYEISKNIFNKFSSSTFQFYFSEGSEEEKNRNMNQMLEEIKNEDFNGYFEYFNCEEQCLPRYKLEKKDELEKMIMNSEKLFMNYLAELQKHGRLEEHYRFFCDIINLESISIELIEKVFCYLIEEHQSKKICNLYITCIEKKIEFPSVLKKKILKIASLEMRQKKTMAEKTLVEFCQKLQFKGLNNIEARSIWSGAPDFNVLFKFDGDEKYCRVDPKRYMELIDEKMYKVKDSEIIDCFLFEFIQEVKEIAEELDINWVPERSEK